LPSKPVSGPFDMAGICDPAKYGELLIDGDGEGEIVEYASMRSDSSKLFIVPPEVLRSWGDPGEELLEYVDNSWESLIGGECDALKTFEVGCLEVTSNPIDTLRYELIGVGRWGG
jgi:hypothetical protein